MDPLSRRLTDIEVDDLAVKIQKTRNKKKRDQLYEAFYKEVVIRCNALMRRYWYLDDDQKLSCLHETLLHAVPYYDQTRGPFMGLLNVFLNRALITQVKSHNAVTKNAPKGSYSGDEKPFADANGGLASGWDLLSPDDTRTEHEAYDDAEELSWVCKRLRRDLSDFELKTLRGFRKGYSYGEIAERLGTDVKNIDNAIQRVMRKAAKRDEFSQVRDELNLKVKTGKYWNQTE